MVSKNIKIIFLISISIFITYVIILFSNYSEISDVVNTHINIKGEVDGQGSKKNLWIASLVNLLVLSLIGFLIKKPHLANYPVEITEKNKDNIYKKMQFFLGIIAIITSASFAFMIFKATNLTDYYIYLILFLILFPLVIIYYFNKKNE